VIAADAAVAEAAVATEDKYTKATGRSELSERPFFITEQEFRRSMSESAAHVTLAPSVRTLDNGLTVVSECLPYLHSATVGVWIRTGSANEEEEHAGISHFLEHLFFKGTKSRTSRELMDAIESRGGHMNAFTTREYTCLYVKTLDDHVPTAIEVLGDIVKNSLFSDLEKERNVILEEIASGIDVPDEHVHDMLTGALWPNHAVGRPIAGSLESVSRTDLEDVQAYKETWYRPENIVIAIVGNVDESTIFERIESEFGSIPRGTMPEQFGTPVPRACIEAIDRDIAQDHMAFAFPSCSLVDPKRYVFDMLSSTLGGGMTSRLFETIREDAGLAYSIYSFNSSLANAGMFGIYAAIAPENLQKTISLCFDELKKLCDTPISDEELQSNREQLKGGLLIALEATFNRMSRIVRSLMYFDRVMTVREILDGVDAVTAEDLQTAAQDIFTKDKCAMAILGPKSEQPVELPF